MVARFPASRVKISDMWRAMKRRCYVPTSHNYRRYGARGITVCREWLESFEVFYKWALANGWRADLQLDRRNNDGNYEPSNCRFVTGKVNHQNRGRLTPRAGRRFIGVKHKNRALPWHAQLEIGGVEYHLGCYSSQEVAAMAYDSAAAVLIGEHARVNFPGEKVVVEKALELVRRRLAKGYRGEDLIALIESGAK